MGRAPCCTKVGLRRGPWSINEDTILATYIQEHGEGQWRSLPKNAGLLRCGKSCRLRWMNYLRPGIKRGNISQDEEDLIVRLHGLLGNRWSLIAGRLPGRTDNEIKNYWNTHLIKKLNSAGLNPKPHKDLPTMPKSKKSSTAAGGGKRKKNQKKVKETIAAEKMTKATTKIEDEKINSSDNDPPKTKVYLPKPIRFSSVFSRTNSYDSLASGTSSSDGVEKAAAAMEVAWPRLFELDYKNYAVVGGREEDFLGVGYIMPVQSDSVSSDVDMWERVYEEYFQLL